MLAYDDRRWLIVDVAFLLICSALLTYNLLAWQRVFGLGPAWRPLQSIALSTCLVLQSLAGFARRRSRRLFYAISALSVTALAVAIRAL